MKKIQCLQTAEKKLESLKDKCFDCEKTVGSIGGKEAKILRQELYQARVKINAVLYAIKTACKNEEDALYEDAKREMGDERYD